jgi:hypothetical protein
VKEKEQEEENPYNSHLNADEVKVRQRGQARCYGQDLYGTEAR